MKKIALSEMAQIICISTSLSLLSYLNNNWNGQEKGVILFGPEAGNQEHCHLYRYEYCCNSWVYQKLCPVVKSLFFLFNPYCTCAKCIKLDLTFCISIFSRDLKEKEQYSNSMHRWEKFFLQIPKMQNILAFWKWKYGPFFFTYYQYNFILFCFYL